MFAPPASPTRSHPIPQGTYEALTGARADLTTDRLGAFSVAAPALGRYTFSSALPGSVCKVGATKGLACVPGVQGSASHRKGHNTNNRPSPPPPQDAVTGVAISFPMTLYLPPIDTTVVNPIALLTVPAASDAAVTKAYNGKPSDGRAPAYLWTRAYALFGYDESKLGVGWGRGPGCTRAAALLAACCESRTTQQQQSFAARPISPTPLTPPTHPTQPPRWTSCATSGPRSSWAAPRRPPSRAPPARS